VKLVSLYGNQPRQGELYGLSVGFEVPGHVCKLVKSIYGLKQAVMVWAERLKRSLAKMGFQKKESDHCIDISTSGILIVFIDRPRSLYLERSNIEIISKANE
jgi:hypothetical protein